jgi:hypothetical protein
MGRSCGIVVAVLLLAIAGLVYKFMFQGSVVAASDGRQAIVLNAAERDLVLTEMRAFLDAVQKITDSVAKKDLKAAAQAAKAVGHAAQQAVPGTLIGKLPIAFKTLGFDTHQKFDLLALDAGQLGDPTQTLAQLSTLMQNCVACHAAYRIDLETAK